MKVLSPTDTVWIVAELSVALAEVILILIIFPMKSEVFNCKFENELFLDPNCCPLKLPWSS